MEYSVLINEISRESHALPLSQYRDDIKQKFLDAVVALSPSASIDNIKQLVVNNVYTITASQISLPNVFVKLNYIKTTVGQNRDGVRFEQVTADKWGELGVDSENDPNKGWCYYYVDGRTLKFYRGVDSNYNGLQVNISFIKYPEQWFETSEMYDYYSSIFIEACKNEAIKNMKLYLRGEQNDMGTG